MLKRLSNNLPLLFLLAGNLYCIWYYQSHPGSFATIVWIYWFQSVTIGLFNFLDLLTVKNYDAGEMRLNGEPVTSRNKGCTAWFFFFHYGIFHFVYGIFLLVKMSILSVERLVLLIAVAAFFLESILNYMRQKEIERTMTVKLGTLFFLPYLRIIPMHLMILGPAFLGWKPSEIFLVLKMAADVMSYLLYHRIYRKKE